MRKEVESCSFCGRNKKRDKVNLIANHERGVAICIQCLSHVTSVSKGEDKVEPYTS